MAKKAKKKIDDKSMAGQMHVLASDIHGPAGIGDPAKVPITENHAKRLRKGKGKKKHARRGRPPSFKTVEELEIKIDEYMQNCPDTKTVYFKLKDRVKTEEVPCPTITGLALHLGFCDRHSFYDYEKREEFTHTIKRARAFIERTYEQLLQTGNPAGAIFALKNFGWRDDQGVNMKVSGAVGVLPTHAQAKKMTDEEVNETLKNYLTPKGKK